MSFVMKCAGLAGVARAPAKAVPVGQYLKRYDPEAFDGQGDAEWTAKLADAIRFPDQVAAMRLWATQPKARPVRDYDGQPNRPLAAFTIEIVPEATEPGGAFGGAR